MGIAAPAVLSDGRRGTCDAVNHLVAHGHQRIAYVTDLRSATMRERYAGSLDGLRSNGLEPDDALVRTDVETAEDAAKTVRVLLALPDPSTALVTGRDGTTIGAARGLHAQYRVAMVGFDDTELADLVDPGLTVIAQDPVAVVRNAVQLLLTQLTDPESPVDGVRVRSRSSHVARASSPVRPSGREGPRTVPCRVIGRAPFGPSSVGVCTSVKKHSRCTTRTAAHSASGGSGS